MICEYSEEGAFPKMILQYLMVTLCHQTNKSCEYQEENPLFYSSQLSFLTHGKSESLLLKISLSTMERHQKEQTVCFHLNLSIKTFNSLRLSTINPSLLLDTRKHPSFFSSTSSSRKTTLLEQNYQNDNDNFKELQ